MALLFWCRVCSLGPQPLARFINGPHLWAPPVVPPPPRPPSDDVPEVDDGGGRGMRTRMLRPRRGPMVKEGPPSDGGTTEEEGQGGRCGALRGITFLSPRGRAALFLLLCIRCVP